jgi:carboxyl-terminal processing protease
MARAEQPQNPATAQAERSAQGLPKAQVAADGAFYFVPAAREEQPTPDPAPRQGPPNRPGPPAPQKEAAACAKNETYDSLLNKTVRKIYDPKILGNIDVLLNKFNCEIKSDDGAIAFAKKAVDSLGDPHSRILDQEETKAQRRRWNGESFGGIGISYQKSPDPDHPGMEIQEVFPNLPAEKAGLRPGDIIVKVNKTDVTSMDLDKTASLIKGPPGTDVALTVKRGTDNLRFVAKRSTVNPPVVSEKLIEDGIAYIKLSTFDRWDAAEEVKKAFLKHRDAPAYVFDLRNNPGGLVDEALKIASMFVGNGNLMTTRWRLDSDPLKPQYEISRYNVASTAQNGQIDQSIEGTPKHYSNPFGKEKDIVDKPVVILVNGNSASASELTTAAVHDNGAATTIGTKTYGKGVMTESIPSVHGTTVKVIVARYYTPKGLWLGDGAKNLIGFTPDIVVDNPSGARLGTAADVQLMTAVKFLQDKIKTKKQ